MTSLENPIIQNNQQIEEQIEFLKKQIKPVHIPIIQKILPFLPYECNVIILDYLELEKKKHYYWIEINRRMLDLLHSKLPYYYLDVKFWNTPKHRNSTTYDSHLDYHIRKKIHIKLLNLKCDKFAELEHYILEHLDCNEEFDTIKQHTKIKLDTFKNKLLDLRDELHSTNDKDFKLRNFEYIYVRGENFRIFGNKSRLNPIPYKKFLYKIGDIVVDYMGAIMCDCELNNKGYYGK